MVDFNFHEIASGTVGADGVLVIPDTKPFFVVYLSAKAPAAH